MPLLPSKINESHESWRFERLATLVACGFVASVIYYYIAAYYHGAVYPVGTPLSNPSVIALGPSLAWACALGVFYLVALFWKAWSGLPTFERATATLVLSGMTYPILFMMERPSIHGLVALALMFNLAYPSPNSEKYWRWISAAFYFAAFSETLFAILDLGVNSSASMVSGSRFLSHNPSGWAAVRTWLTHPLGTHVIEDQTFSSELGWWLGPINLAAIGFASYFSWKKRFTIFEQVTWCVFSFVLLAPLGLDDRLAYILVSVVALLSNPTTLKTHRSETIWILLLSLLLVPKTFRVLLLDVTSNGPINALLLIGGLAAVWTASSRRRAARATV